MPECGICGEIVRDDDPRAVATYRFEQLALEDAEVTFCESCARWGARVAKHSDLRPSPSPAD
jgi:ribosome-binding protein aMBF1 (putative translation factor)